MSSGLIFSKASKNGIKRIIVLAFSFMILGPFTSPIMILQWPPQTSRSGGLDPGLWESECFLLSPESQARLRSAIVPIIPEFNNQNPQMHFVYLGTHELGHTFDLHDCLFGNGCTICSAGNCSIREAWVEAVARHNLRL
jgi:hypothetical protein